MSDQVVNESAREAGVKGALERKRDELRAQHDVNNNPDVFSPHSFNACLSLVLPVLEAAEQCMWINECKCDPAWTNRKKHEPKSVCGEMDELAKALATLRAELGMG